MECWITAKKICDGNTKQFQRLTKHKTKEEAEKEAFKIRKETGENIYIGNIIKKEGIYTGIIIRKED